MDKHTVNDAQVATLLGGSPTEENTRLLTQNFSSTDFEYTLNRVQHHANPNLAGAWYAVLRKLRDERRDAEVRVAEQAAAEHRHAVAEEANERRHADLARRVADLKKPHWSIVPTFWFTVISAVAAVAAAYFGWLALKR